MSKRTRPRLGLIGHGIEYAYQESILRGADEECRAEDADLICFAGGALVFDQMTDATYDVIDAAALDGMMIALGTLGAATGTPRLRALIDRFATIPLCSLGYELPGALSVVVDGTNSVCHLTRHLIDVHGRRRLAFIQGNSAESNERLEGFRKGLASSGVPCDPRFVFEGNFLGERGAEVAKELLALRDQTPGAPFPVDAIVAANDWMAIGAMQALEAAGVRVPEEVSIVGFDDVEEARFEMPSITTIRQPTEKLGALGVKALLARCRGEDFPLVTRLATEHKLRKSCGCFAGGQISQSLAWTSDHGAIARAKTRLERIASALDDSAAFRNILGDDWSKRLTHAFDGDIHHPRGEFLALLDNCLRATATLGNISAWHYVVTTLKRHGLPEGASAEQLNRAMDLVDMAQVLVSTHAERVQGARRLAKEELLRQVTGLSEALRTASDYAGIARVLACQLPRLGVPGCAITVHEGSLTPDTETELVAAFEVERGLAPPRRMRAGDLLPAEAMPSHRSTWIAKCATFERLILGYCLLEVDTVETPRYSAIFEQIGLSLNAIRLLRAMVEEMTLRERAERERLENEIAIATRIQAAILPRSQEVRGLSVACAMHAATEVGGDYFDILPFERGAWFAIGDVAGHGLPAGLVMLMIQSIVAAITMGDPDARASVVWTHLNRVLYENIRNRLGQDEHVTLTLLRHAGRGEFEFAGAHEEILVHRAMEHRVDVIETPGIWAGITPQPAPEALRDSHLSLAVGDTMLLCTDGVVEARNAQGELFGHERLSAEFLRLSPLPVRDIVEQLMQSVRAFMHEQTDDMTLVVVRNVGEGQRE